MSDTPTYDAVAEDLAFRPDASSHRSHIDFMKDAGQDAWYKSVTQGNVKVDGRPKRQTRPRRNVDPAAN